MPGRFEKMTRTGPPRRAVRSVHNRGPNGRRRFGCRAEPLHPTRQARVHARSPLPKAVRRTHRFRGAMRWDGPGRASGAGPAPAARYPATPCGWTTVRLVGQLVRTFAAGTSQEKQTVQPTRRDHSLAIQDNPGSPQAHVEIPIRSMRSEYSAQCVDPPLCGMQHRCDCVPIARCRRSSRRNSKFTVAVMDASIFF